MFNGDYFYASVAPSNMENTDDPRIPEREALLKHFFLTIFIVLFIIIFSIALHRLLEIVLRRRRTSLRREEATQTAHLNRLFEPDRANVTIAEQQNQGCRLMDRISMSCSWLPSCVRSHNCVIQVDDDHLPSYQEVCGIEAGQQTDEIELRRSASLPVFRESNQLNRNISKDSL
ncbi:hypothetical protein ACOME3_005476 [Neoechinorhynchus agilis]